MIELPLSALTICMPFNFSLFLMCVILFLKRYFDTHIVVDVYKVGPDSWLLAIGSNLVHICGKRTNSRFTSSASILIQFLGL